MHQQHHFAIISISFDMPSQLLVIENKINSHSHNNKCLSSLSPTLQFPGNVFIRSKELKRNRDLLLGCYLYYFICWGQSKWSSWPPPSSSVKKVCTVNEGEEYLYRNSQGYNRSLPVQSSFTRMLQIWWQIQWRKMMNRSLIAHLSRPCNLPTIQEMLLPCSWFLFCMYLKFYSHLNPFLCHYKYFLHVGYEF